MQNSKTKISTPSHPQSGIKRLVWALFFGLLAITLSACGEEEKAAPRSTYEFDVQVSVTNDDGFPVPKAPVILDGNTVGYTDRDGLYEAVLTDYVGTEVTLSLGDMEAYAIPESTRSTTQLKRVKTIDGFSTNTVRLQATLESLRNDYLIWIDINCAEEVADEHCQDLPIKFEGEEIARTDEQGRAHFDFQGVPEQVVTLNIETPSYTPSEGDTADDYFDITPANPSYDIELGLDAEVLTIKETFTDPKAAKRLAKKKKRQRAAARRRARQRRKAQKKKAEEKAKKDGVIDLW